MPLLAGGRLTVAAVGARNLHLLATREALGPLRGQEVELPGSLPGLEWALRFYDPVVVPALGLIDERETPAYAEVRHALGITTTVYHVVAQPGSGLTPHHAGHVGAGLASGHSAAARDFETIRSRVRGREHLVDELIGAAAAGLPHAQALLARAIAPHNPAVAAAADASPPDPDAVRKALLDALGRPPRVAPGAPAMTRPAPPLAVARTALSRNRFARTGRSRRSAGGRGRWVTRRCPRCGTRRGCSRRSGPARSPSGCPSWPAGWSWASPTCTGC